MNKIFNSTILILPGLGNSGDGHWQTLWEKEYGFQRVEQKDWETPELTDWVDTLQSDILRQEQSSIILIGHSLACCMVAYWSEKFGAKIKGALLVAPSDTEAPSYPPGTKGFTPMPLNKLPFPSIVAASSNDPYVSIDRASLFSNAWGSKFINIGKCGHVNVASGHGPWGEGLLLLKELDSKAPHY